MGSPVLASDSTVCLAESRARRATRHLCRDSRFARFRWAVAAFRAASIQESDKSFFAPSSSSCSTRSTARRASCRSSASTFADSRIASSLRASSASSRARTSLVTAAMACSRTRLASSGSVREA